MGMARCEGSSESAVVIDVNAASSLGCLRSLSEHEIHTVVASETDTAPSFSSKYCDESVVVPSPDRDIAAYKDALLELAARPDVRAIFPLRAADIYVLAKYRRDFANHIETPWPAFETFEMVYDRRRLFDAATSAGVSIPETTLLDEFDEWEREVVVKSRYTVDVDGTETGYVSTLYPVPGERPAVDAITTAMGHVPIVQEYVPGDEYGLFALYDRDGPIATFQHRQLRGTTYAGGPSAYRTAIDDPDLEAAGLRLLDALDWYGLAMVEFKQDPDTGEYKLMEVNPRFWSSLPFTVQAGVDFPYYYWCLATERPCEVPAEYRTDIAGHSLLAEGLYLASLLSDDIGHVDRPTLSRSVASLAASIVRQPNFDYLAIDDLRPFFSAIMNNLDKIRTPEQPALDEYTERADNEPLIDTQSPVEHR